MKTTALITAALLTAASAPAMSFEAEAEDIIKYRASAMKAYAGHAGAAARIVREKVDFPGQLNMHVQAMIDLSTMMADWFPEDSDFGDTRAKPEVWTKRAEFDQKVKENQDAARMLMEKVDAGDKAGTAKAFKALSDTCKSCHENFRTVKE